MSGNIKNCDNGQEASGADRDKNMGNSASRGIAVKNCEASINADNERKMKIEKGAAPAPEEKAAEGQTKVANGKDKKGGLRGLSAREISTAKFRKVLFFLLAISGAAVLISAICGFSLVVRDASVGERLFGDFWETARFSLAENPYNEEFHSSYPPAAFLPMAPFALICKDALSLSMAEASKAPLFVLSVSLFYTLNFALCGLLLCRLTRTRVFSLDGGLRFLTVGASFPAVFMIARGNVIILSALFLLLFLNFYQSESRLLRIFACLSLGAAGAMKLYVLSFALLYVRRGKMQSALLAAAFFAAAFFLPFLCYGKGAFSAWRQHMSGFLGDTSGMAHANNMGILQLVIAPLSLVRIAGAELPGWISKIYLLLQLLFAAIVTVTAVFDKNRSRQFLLISLCCCQIANPSYAYILVMLFPAVFFALEKEKIPLPFAAALLFVLCPLCYIKPIGCYLQCFALSALTVTLIVRSLRSIGKETKKGEAFRRVSALFYGFIDNGKRAEAQPWEKE